MSGKRGGNWLQNFKFNVVVGAGTEGDMPASSADDDRRSPLPPGAALPEPAQVAEAQAFAPALPAARKPATAKQQPAKKKSGGRKRVLSSNQQRFLQAVGAQSAAAKNETSRREKSGPH